MAASAAGRLLLTLALALAPLAARAADAGSETGLPLPRFASLGTDRVNVRTGPGTRYPVAWVFVREALPIEVVGEFEQWRRVRDRDGAEGWVHKAMLSGRRTVVVTGGVRTLHAAPRPDSPPVARVEAGVLGRLDSCRNDWCEVAFAGYRGWMPAGEMWGAEEISAVR